MPDSNLGPKWRHLARVLRGEQATTKAARKALAALLEYAAGALASAGYDVSHLSAQASGWTKAASATVLPAIEEVFLASFNAAGQGIIDPAPYATPHMEAVANRLAGVPDDVFDTVRVHLEEGRRLGEDIPQLAARVDALLTDTQRWDNRAVTIARTETIGAANAGAVGSAYATADLLGYESGDVTKTWLATGDGRTRETHAEADGQTVMGLDTPFDVGGYDLDQPGDPFGPPEEVVCCRCTVLFSYPGDPDYPTDAPAATSVGDSAADNIPANMPAPAAPLEHPTDPGPQTDQERMARALTLDELVMEMRRGSAGAKAAARAELRRRGFPGVASGRVKAALRAAGQEQDMAENEETRTGVVVVALPAADDPVRGIGPEDKHCTLLYFGDVAGSGGSNENPGLTDEFRSLLSQVVATYAGRDDGTVGTFAERVTGVESLGAEGARVWVLASDDGVAAIRADLLDTDTEVATVLSGVEQYPTFKPHVTIGYADVEVADAAPSEDVTVEGQLDPETEAAAAAVESITFDRLALWWAGEQTEWPLAAPAEETPVDDTTPEDVQAALLTLQRAGLALSRRAGQITAADGDPLPGPDGSPAPTEEPPATASEIPTDGPPLYGILWPEGVQSGDARAIEAGATTWRDLPLPLMAQDAQAMGHDGAVRVARIDTIERDDTTYSVPVLRYTGVWDSSPIAAETMRQVDAGVARGVSVDGDAVTVELRGSDGAPLDPMVDDFPADGVVVEVATAARIAGATACSVPAFQQAYVANGTLADRTIPEPGWNEDGTPKDNVIGQPAEGETEVGDQPLTEPVAASAAPAWSLTAAAGPEWASRDFANPGLTEPTRLTITDDGRVYGHLATWGICHIGIDGICQEPPVSATNYAYFATGAVPTDAGYASVGQLTMETGHAGMNLGHRAAVAHYDNTGTAVCDVAMGQDDVGIWYAGRLRPGTTPEQVYAMRAAGSVSGDWREVGGQLELVAALVVNVPGFPIPAPSIAASGTRPVAMVASGVVRPTTAPAKGTTDEAALHAAVETVLANRERQHRALVASTRIRRDRAAAAALRLTAQRRARATAAAARLTERS